MKASLRSAALALALSARAVAADPPPDKQQCTDAYVQGQILRQASKLVAARQQFYVCSNVACPSVVGHDCRKWRDELDSAIPSVVFDVKDARGEQAFDAKVELDGAPLAGGLDGRAVAVDPGKHVFTFHLGSEPPLRREVTVLEGAKAQRVEASFVRGEAAGAAAQAQAPAATSGRSSRPVPAIAWVLGAIGIGGVGGFAYFGLTANARESDLRATCAPFCAESQREHVRALQIGADMSLVAALVSLGLGAYFVLMRPEVQTPRTAGSSL
jgi:hypothetical protein